MDIQLIDRIYESCFEPEIWPDVLDELGRIAGAPGASLFVSKGDALHCVASPEPRERAERIVKEGWLRRGTIVARLFAQRHAGFLIDVEYFTPEELDREPIYRDLWRPQGVGWGMGTAIPIPTGENATIILSRPMEYGPFDRASANRLDEFRPHLARSVLISARLQLDRARVAGDALAALGIPALVFDETGKVLSANALIEEMTGYVHWRAFDRVSLKDRAADQLLRGAIAIIDSEKGSGVRSFPIRDAEAESTMVAHVIPVRLSARDIFLRCAGVLAMTPVTTPRAPPVELVQSLFDLTPTEARVARSLASGKTVEDIASDGGVSLNTVRTHVRGVLAKTGCGRQVEVVALLTGIAASRAAGPNLTD
jgi:DNA-binding CsgD family transcriptional regulator/PAS domain-containing protein